MWDEPWVRGYGHSAGKIHGCRQLPAVPTPAPLCPPQPRCAPGGAAGCEPSPAPRNPLTPCSTVGSSPPRAAVAKADGRAPLPSPRAAEPRGEAAGARWPPGLPGGSSRWPQPCAGLAPVRVGARVGSGPRASSSEHMICCGRFPAAWSQPRASHGDGFNCFQIR